MAKDSFDTMSAKDLEKERQAAQERLREIERAQGEYRGRRLKELKAEIEETLSKEGFTLADLGLGRGSQKSSPSRSKGAPKYANPADTSQTWSGRGRQPQWYKEQIAAGVEPESMAV